MYYRILQKDHWEISASISRNDVVISGGEVINRYLPQYARSANGPWRTFADLGFQRDGFTSPRAAEVFLERKNARYRQTYQGVSSSVEEVSDHPDSTLRLTTAQDRLLRQLLDEDPELRLYSDVVRNGEGRNPTFRVLSHLGLVQYTQVAGNSFRARLTVRGIHYLHGE
jgi:hypothetical protein